MKVERDKWELLGIDQNPVVVADGFRGLYKPPRWRSAIMLVRKLGSGPYKDQRYAICILIAVFPQDGRPSFAALGSKDLNFDETAIVCHGGSARSRKEVEATCLNALSFVQYPILLEMPSVARLTQRASNGA